MSKQEIILDSDFISWQWYTDANTMRVFMHLLLLSLDGNKHWRNEHIKEGQCITGVIHIAVQLSLTVQQVRTALKKLKSSKYISVLTTTQHSKITILNWERYTTNAS